MSLKIEFNLENLENLCKLCPTYEEIATFFGCHKTTIINRMNAEPEFKAAMQAGYNGAKMALRRWQMQAAENGNTAMLIFLGKNILGQQDSYNHVIQETLKQVESIHNMSDYELKQYIESGAKRLSSPSDTGVGTSTVIDAEPTTIN
jgi:hypothetical protein